MIIFDLKCPSGHVFESWFGSTADYEAQKARGLVACPICGAPEVEKAPMAPAVGAKGNSRSAIQSHTDLVSADPESVKAMLAAAAAMQKSLLRNSEAVGERFTDEARAMHIGDSPSRAIHGRATREQAESLIEEGIPVASLPFPIAEPSEEN